VVRPWEDERQAALPANVRWTVLSDTALALLGPEFTAATARWPSLSVRLLERAVGRSQSLATQLAITCLVGVDIRLHALFWHLADRWGKVTSEGTLLELP
jgi:CRP/FNR family cyclic AMP-dependent transcriptional regulator